MIALQKAAALVAALFRGLGVQLHPKVAATPVGASVAGVVIAVLAVAGVHVPAAGEATLAVVCTIVAGYLHPATDTPK